MKNKYGLPEYKLGLIAKRDISCVYCDKKMLPRGNKNRKNAMTVEHLDDEPPWNNIDTIAMCCGSCNSSRGKKKITEWFNTDYCKSRDINYCSVAQVVRGYIDKYVEK